MNHASLAITFRIGLAFHALNNEGSSGTNVMEPRRISVGGQDYDGISGEMVRRHVFENLVRIAEERGLALSTSGAGLLPDRAKDLLKVFIGEHRDIPLVKGERDKGRSGKKKSEADGEGESAGDEDAADAKGRLSLRPQDFPAATRRLLERCAVTDIGGYLAALEGKETATRDGVAYSVAGSATLKRDSTFDVGWLVSEGPAVVEYTQHAAYRLDGQHNLFTQNMRAGVYGGVARLDLARVGRNDWAWMQPQGEREAAHLPQDERARRVLALVDAWERWLLSPSGAKQAGWLQHTGLLEGALVLSNSGPAPFISPIEVSTRLEGEEAVQAIRPNEGYLERLEALAASSDGRFTVLRFGDPAGLLGAFREARRLAGLQG